MKKILSLILSLVIAAQLLVLPASAKTHSEPEHSWKVMNGLGLTDYDDSQTEETITRAEFAQLIATMLGVVSSQNETGPDATLFNKAFYDGMSYDGYSPKSNETLYEDIDSGHENFDAIYALKNLGIMRGDGTGYFHPNDTVKYEQVLRVFVMLAANNVDPAVDNAWINGYLKMAEDMDITVRGIGVGNDVTKIQLSQILYKLFMTDMLYVYESSNDTVIYKKKGNETFLNKVLGLYTFEGQVEATSDSTLTMAYASKDGSLTINGVNYKNEINAPIGNLLGRTVEAYRTDDNEVVFMTAIDDDDVTVINQGDEVTYSGGNLSYSQKSRRKTVDISGLPVIYNGAALATYSPDIFRLCNGTITITEKADQDVVIIWDPKDMLIGKVNENNMEIFDEVTGYAIDLGDDNTVYIYDEDGNAADISALTSGTIISYIENGTYKEIHIGGKTEEGTFRSVDTDDETITLAEKTYSYTRALDDNNEIITLSYDNTVTLYINSLGRVFHVENGKKVGEDNGILRKVFENEDGDIVLRIFGNDGKFADFKCRERVSFTDSHNNTSRLVSAGIENALSSYIGELVVYTVNADNEVTQVQIPLENKSYQKAGEEKLYAKKFALTKSTPFVTGWNALGNVFLNGDVRIFSVPQNAEDSASYERLAVSNLLSYEFFTGTAYYKNEDKPVPVAVVTHDRNIKESISLSNGPQVVTGIRTAIVDDEIVKEVDLTEYNGKGTVRTVYSKIGSDGKSAFDSVISFAADTNNTSSPSAAVLNERYVLGKGDIVFYTLKDEKTNEIGSIRILYDCDMASPSDADGSKKAKLGWFAGFGYIDDKGAYSNQMPITKANYNSWKASEYKDNLIDYANANALDFGYFHNPAQIDSRGLTYASNSYRYWKSGNTFMLGYAVDYVDGYLKLTTQDLSCEDYNPDYVETVSDTTVAVNYEQWFNTTIQYSHMYLIEYHVDGPVIRNGYPADLYTWKTSGRKASRIFVYEKNFIIINDYR